MKSAGLPPGFHEAAGEIYRRLSVFKDTPPPTVEEASRRLLQQPHQRERKRRTVER